MMFSNPMAATRIYTWKSWIRGLNTLQSPVNIKDNELATATNVILSDEGHPTRRDGTGNFGDSISATTVPSLVPHYDKSGTNVLLAIASGYGYIRNDSNGSMATVSSAASWPSSTAFNWAMLNNVTYIASDVDPLTKFDGTYLTRFTTITSPTGLAVARGASLASGQFKYSYKITAENTIGETTASTAVTVQVDKNRNEWNFDPSSPNSNYSVNLTWNTVSGAIKYNIYGVEEGYETYLDSVQTGLSYRDYGIKTPSVLFSAPTGNSTDAPRGEYVKTYKSSLFIAGDPTEPSRLYYSAGVDKPDSFTISDGGGWIDINRNADDGVIRGLGIYQDSMIIFKEYSIWKFDFTTSLIPSLSLIKNGLGAISHKTIIPVENDLFFAGKSIGASPGIYVLGNEPNFVNIIRTNELSARVRPEVTVTNENYEKSCAVYSDNKYYWFFASGSSTYNDTAIVYDRERLGFTKFNSVYVHNPLVWRDSDNDEKFIYGDGNDKRVTEYGSTYSTDKGTAISWEIRTKQQQNKIMSQYERTKWVNFMLKNPIGNLTFNFYHDNDIVSYSTDAGVPDTNTAFGYWQFGVGQFGTTDTSSSSTTSDIRNLKFPIHRTGTSAIANTFGIGISGTSALSNMTLLGTEFERKEMSKNYRDFNDVYQI
jgi:hypothetical protein